MKTNKKIVAISAIGTAYILKQILDRRKLKEMELEISSLNKSMNAVAEAHNNLADAVDENHDLCAEEIASVYEHLAELSKQ